jgi:alpha-tubulin suppressor-like RCC1 family protein
MRIPERHLRLIFAFTLLSSLVGYGAFGTTVSSVAAAPMQGAVYGFGANYNGEVGDGTTTQRNLPTRAGGLPAGVTAIAVGAAHSLALAGGKVYAWGDDYFGELGDGTAGSPASNPTPTEITLLPPGVTAIAAGQNHSLALVDGKVYAWGDNSTGQLGNGTTGAPNPTPTQVLTGVTGLPAGVTAIAAGGSALPGGFSLALAGGKVYAWGDNSTGQLGNGTTGGNNPTPVQVLTGVTGLPGGVTAIGAGQAHGLAVADGKVYAWGWDQNGQLGDGTIGSPVYQPTPMAVPGLAGVTAVTGGWGHSLALANGVLYAWGANGSGQLGDGTTPGLILPDSFNRPTPEPVRNPENPGPFKDVVAFAAGPEYSLAARTDGTAFAWGANGTGNLGSNTSLLSPTPIPQPVLVVHGVVAVAAGGILGTEANSLALTSDPVITPSPTSVDFGAQTINTTSSSHTVTLTNTGGGPLTITGITTNGSDFGQTSNCPALLPAGANCAINITFTPLALGKRVGTLVITDSAEGSPHTGALAGTGAAATAQYTVTASATGSGTISPTGSAPYIAGSEATYSATPDAGQVFLGWTLDGVYVGYASPLKFTVNSSRTLVAAFAARPSFTDVPTTDADYQAITFLAALGIVNPNGVNGAHQFQPDADVKRAEVAAFIARVFDWDTEFHANFFPDRCDQNNQNCVDDELWNDVAALADYGVVGGYTDTATCASVGTIAPCYLPRDPVKRVQVVSIIARAFIKTPVQHPGGVWDRLPADQAQYTNVPDIGTQRSDLTTYRANAGAVPGQTSTSAFPNPEDPGSRRFIIAALYQAYAAQYGIDRVP